MHSCISLDGEYTPSELAVLCKQKGLCLAALADHNSVRGVQEFQRAAAAQQLTVLEAIELDCTCGDTDLHLLGYGIDSGDARFAALENNILEQMRQSSQRLLAVLHQMGVPFEDAAVMRLARDGIVVGEMVAQAALEDPRSRQSPIMAPYLPGGARADNPQVNFFWDFCAQGKPAFAPVQYPTFLEAQRLISDTGGFSVIAHPGNTVGRNTDMIEYMVQNGVWGIEVFSSYHTTEQIEYYSRLANTLGIAQTIGSDFHGKTKPAVHLGETHGQAAEQALLERLLPFGITIL